MNQRLTTLSLYTTLLSIATMKILRLPTERGLTVWDPAKNLSEYCHRQGRDLRAVRENGV